MEAQPRATTSSECYKRNTVDLYHTLLDNDDMRALLVLFHYSNDQTSAIETEAVLLSNCTIAFL
jgi:hypothetical protein